MLKLFSKFNNCIIRGVGEGWDYPLTISKASSWHSFPVPSSVPASSSKRRASVVPLPLALPPVYLLNLSPLLFFFFVFFLLILIINCLFIDNELGLIFCARKDNKNVGIVPFYIRL